GRYRELAFECEQEMTRTGYGAPMHVRTKRCAPTTRWRQPRLPSAAIRRNPLGVARRAIFSTATPREGFRGLANAHMPMGEAKSRLRDITTTRGEGPA
ncbi:hypothetical protein LTR74_013278, partial [Friedmanniomyces endolithicus]